MKEQFPCILFGLIDLFPLVSKGCIWLISLVDQQLPKKWDIKWSQLIEVWICLNTAEQNSRATSQGISAAFSEGAQTVGLLGRKKQRRAAQAHCLTVFFWVSMYFLLFYLWVLVWLWDQYPTEFAVELQYQVFYQDCIYIYINQDLWRLTLNSQETSPPSQGYEALPGQRYAILTEPWFLEVLCGRPPRMRLCHVFFVFCLKTYSGKLRHCILQVQQRRSKEEQDANNNR